MMKLVFNACGHSKPACGLFNSNLLPKLFPPPVLDIFCIVQIWKGNAWEIWLHAVTDYRGWRLTVIIPVLHWLVPCSWCCKQWMILILSCERSGLQLQALRWTLQERASTFFIKNCPLSLCVYTIRPPDIIARDQISQAFPLHIFAYCKWPKSRGGNGLGMRLNCLVSRWNYYHCFNKPATPSK